MKIVSAREAVSIIQDGWTISPGGFGSCGHPDALSAALAQRFIETGQPRGLTYLFASGPGDRKDRGLNAIALPGLVSVAIGGFWGLAHKLSAMAVDGDIEAHNWPQGVVSKLFTAIASGAPGVLTQVGLDTFVDPAQQGGVLDSRGSATRIQSLALLGRRWLLYPSLPLHCAWIRGSSMDSKGNISFEEETSYMDALAQAIAAKNSGGVVLVQVKRLVDTIPPQQVRIPGKLVDFATLSPPGQHPQTYGQDWDSAYTSASGGERSVDADGGSRRIPHHKAIIAHRAALELRKHPGASVNLGIGIPALIGPVAQKLGIQDYTLTVESGLIGGTPDEGLSFGASRHPEAFVEQSALFDFYDGGGIDVAFLGFAQVDALGNINVSRFGSRIPGAGGFINISQSARKIVFCGSFTAGGTQTSCANGQLSVDREGGVRKFLQQLEQLTFNARRALAKGQDLMLITERAVFRIDAEGLVLMEIAPGITVESLIGQMDFPLHVSPELRLMPGPWDAGAPHPRSCLNDAEPVCALTS